MASAAHYAAPLESTRAKILEAHRVMAGSKADGVREAAMATIEWLEQPSGFNVVGPAIASVAGSASQRSSYLDLARNMRSLRSEVEDLRTKNALLLDAMVPDLRARFDAAAASLIGELTRSANVILCLVDARDEGVSDEDARLADRLRFESAKGVVLTMHDDAFRRLAK